MSSSSSSYGSGDDLADVSEIDVAAESNGFGGWGLEDISFEGLAPSGNLMVKSKEEPWPQLDDSSKKATKKKKRIQIGNDNDDEALYDAIVESEQEEEEEESTTTTIPPPPAVPKSPPCDEEEEFETEEEVEEEEDVSKQPSQYQHVPGPTPVLLPPPLELEDSGGESESEFETEELEEVPQKVTTTPSSTTKVEPIPKESIPELANRGEEADEAKEAKSTESSPIVQSKEMQKTLETAKDVQEILEKNLNEKNKVVDSAKDAEELKKLRDALAEFHKYAATPNDKRAVSFKNNIFNAKSKDITVSHEKRLFLALKCLEKMTALPSIGVKDADKTRFVRTTPNLSVDSLMSQLSHALAAFISSQENVPSATRRALAQALIADVTKSSSANSSVARTTLILAGTIGNMLLSEAASLKTASLVTSSQEKRTMFDGLRRKIIADVDKFVEAISVAVPSAAATKKILQQISAVSENFRTAALKFSSISGHESGKSGDSYATSLSMLLRQFTQYGPSVTEYNANQDFVTMLIFQANMLMPDLIMYPEATYDVLAGMLDGLKGTFNVVDSAQDRQKIIASWNQIKTDLSDQTSYLSENSHATVAKTETKSSQPTTSKLEPKQQQPPATTTTKQTEKKQSAVSAQEEHFISRFSHISDDED